MIEPLRSRKLGSGELYQRPQPIQLKLEELETLSGDDLLARARIGRKGDPNYIPSECLVSILRARKWDNNEAYFRRLYDLLFARVLRALPKDDDKSTSLTGERIRDDVVGRFNELLSADRLGYVERLDYFEIRFDGAIARLRSDARERAWKAENRHASLEFDEETGEPSAEVERAAGSFDPFTSAKYAEADYRLQLDEAINSLPVEQNRIITMLRDGFPIDAKDPSEMTISKALGKSEKTIRTHRDKAFEAIRAFIEGERP